MRTEISVGVHAEMSADTDTEISAETDTEIWAETDTETDNFRSLVTNVKKKIQSVPWK